MDPREALAHPLWWASLALLVLNDHVLKGAGVLPAQVTGKLSDVAGMVVAPALLAHAVGARSRRGMLACAVLVAVAFALLKTYPPAADAVLAWSTRLGLPCRIWCDPWDLLAVPFSLTTLWLASHGSDRSLLPRRAEHSSRTSLLIHHAAVVLGGLGCVATSYARGHVPNQVQADQVGIVYAATWDGVVRVIDADAGQVLSSIDLGVDDPWDWLASGDRIFTASGTQGIRAFDARNRERAFQTHIVCSTCPVRLFLDTPYLLAFVLHPGDSQHAAAEWLFALDRDSGSVAWWRKLTFSELGGDGDMPAVTDSFLIVPSPGGLIEIRTDSGETRRTIPANAPKWLKIRDGRVYFLSGSGELTEMDIATGTELWRAKAAYDTATTTRRPFGLVGDLLVYTESGALTGVDRVTKQKAWQIRFPEGGVLGDELAFVPIAGHGHGVFDLRDGRELWRWQSAFEIVQDPAFVGGLLLFRGRASELNAYEARTGRKRWTVDYGNRGAALGARKDLRIASGRLQ